MIHTGGMSRINYVKLREVRLGIEERELIRDCKPIMARAEREQPTDMEAQESLYVELHRRYIESKWGR